MKTTNLKWIVYALSALVLLLSCKASQNSDSRPTETTTSQKRIKVKPYKVWVTKLDGTKLHGFLFSANENDIVMTDNYTIPEQRTAIEVSKIKKIKLRRNGNVGRMALYLGGSGAILGGGMGLASGDDPENQWFRSDAEEKARAGLIVGGVLGAGFGALFGSIKKKMIINGNIYSYNMHLTKLKECSINSQNIE